MASGLLESICGCVLADFTRSSIGRQKLSIHRTDGSFGTGALPESVDGADAEVEAPDEGGGVADDEPLA
ncbi:hypothetical protein [Labedaea rhizosphaerae]|uniref:hypothetical protein n=1 Tax=Labedaea rhizosphaerae TaxID=598644 RepID=UPI00105C6912|nr:hypothetical protein [Labedaea rhizosphaerae]